MEQSEITPQLEERSTFVIPNGKRSHLYSLIAQHHFYIQFFYLSYYHTEKSIVDNLQVFWSKI